MNPGPPNMAVQDVSSTIWKRWFYNLWEWGVENQSKINDVDQFAAFGTFTVANPPVLSNSNNAVVVWVSAGIYTVTLTDIMLDLKYGVFTDIETVFATTGSIVSTIDSKTTSSFQIKITNLAGTLVGTPSMCSFRVAGKMA